MKIFGIGWHKTATHSLQDALNILGYEGVHYPYHLYFHFNKARGEVRDYLDSYSSCTDFPVPLYFENLDRMYPDSKFILTTRDEQSWLASIERHFEFMRMPRKEFGGQSEDDYKIAQGIPIHEIHERAYGQSHFEADHFLTRYRRHNDHVLHYFADRRDDLLVMDMSNGDGWASLCDFLGAELPDIPYPVKYQACEREREVLG